MSGTPSNPPSNMAPRVEVEEQHDETVSADIGFAKSDRTATSFNADATSVELDPNAPAKPDPKDAPKSDEGAPEPDGEKGDEADEGADDKEATDLGEWKKDDPETQEKFDAHYFKDGVLNKDALTKEFWANAKEGVDGSLNEATYNYLTDTLGVSKDMVKELETGLVANAKAQSDAFFSKVPGGAAAYEKAVKWGREGGYTEAQRERFNAAQKEGGVAFEDAVEALMARFAKANPGEANLGRRGPPQGQRRSAPARSTSTSERSGGDRPSDTFASKQEYSQAWSEGLKAQKDAKDPAAKRAAKDHLDDLRRKARRSRFA